jgi:hypothetical protein
MRGLMDTTIPGEAGYPYVQLLTILKGKTIGYK